MHPSGGLVAAVCGRKACLFALQLFFRSTMRKNACENNIGSYIREEKIWHVKCTEFVIQPQEDHPPLDVDGEKKKPIATHAKVIQKRLAIGC